MKASTSRKRIIDFFYKTEYRNKIEEFGPHVIDLDNLKELMTYFKPTVGVIDERLWWAQEAKVLFTRLDIPTIEFIGDFEQTTKLFCEFASNFVEDNIDSTVEEIAITRQEPETAFKPEYDLTKKVDLALPKVDPVKENDTTHTEQPKVVITKVEEKIKYVSRYAAIPSQLIVVGSMFDRAGASFVTSNLARAISSYNLLTTVIEAPCNRPYLYDAMAIDNKDEDFYSWCHDIISSGSVQRNNEYQENGVSWILLHPELPPISDFSYEQYMKLIYSVKRVPFILFDIGTNWLDPVIQSVLSQADYIFTVLEPDPVLLNRTIPVEKDGRVAFKTDEVLIIEKIAKLHVEEKIPFDFVVNKMTPGVDKNIIEETLFKEPVTYIPAFDTEKMYKLLWEGKLLYDDPDIQHVLDNCFYAMLKRIVPVQYLTRDHAKSSGKKTLLSIGKSLLQFVANKKEDKQ